MGLKSNCSKLETHGQAMNGKETGLINHQNGHQRLRN